MKFKDYIFYRLYVNYTKAKEDGVFSSVIAFSILEYFLFIPITIFIAGILNLSKGWDYIPFIIPLIIFFFLNYKRYYKKGKMEEIIKQYKNSKYNKTIRNWMIYTALVGLSLWGLFSVYYFLKLVSYIVSLIR